MQLAAYKLIKESRPDLVEAAEIAAAKGDDGGLRQALAGAIEVAAADGHVQIEGAHIAAVKSASFDHQTGTIVIGVTKIHAPVLVTGGGTNATGETRIGGGTVLSSAATSINMGAGASIRMTGNASIKQS